MEQPAHKLNDYINNKNLHIALNSAICTFEPPGFEIAFFRFASEWVILGEGKQ